MTAAVVMTSISPTGGDAGLTIPVGALVSVAVGAGCGLLNGLLVTKVKLGAFITTLGTLGIWTGGIDLLHGGTEIANLPSALGGIGSTAYGGWFTIPVIVMAVLAVVLGVVLAKTRFGMNTYAIGSSEVAARRGGINVESHMVAVYTLAGLLAGVAGFLVMARFSDASPLAGANDELDAIAATVIGGASLLGGRGSVAGTTIGTAIVSILVTGLVLINLSSFWQEVAVGVVLIGAITIDRVSRLART
jgi:ribose transport system permease protein